MTGDLIRAGAAGNRTEHPVTEVRPRLMDTPDQPATRPRPGRLFRFSWFFYLFLAIGGIVWLGMQRGALPLEIFLDTETWWRDLAAGLGVAALLLALWAAARRWLAAARGLEERVAEMLGPIDSGEVVGLAFLSATAEEIFFRGAVQQAWGWWVAAALFAILHSGPGRALRLWTVFAALAGLALGGVTVVTGNLLAPITAHFLVNAVGLGRIGRRQRAAGGRAR